MIGVALLIEAFEKRHDLFAGFGIEVTGRLVGQDDRRIVDQGAGDGDALALPAGEFVRLVRQRGRPARRRRSAWARPLLAFLRIDPGVDQRQLDIPQAGGAGRRLKV